MQLSRQRPPLIPFPPPSTLLPRELQAQHQLFQQNHMRLQLSFQSSKEPQVTQLQQAAAQEPQVIPIPLEPLLTPAPQAATPEPATTLEPLENQAPQAAVPEPQVPQEPQEPLETHEPQEAATDPQETQEATLEPQMIPLPLEPQEPREAALEPLEIIIPLEIQEQVATQDPQEVEPGPQLIPAPLSPFPLSPSQHQLSFLLSPFQQSTATLSLFHSPIQHQSISAIRLNSTQLQDTSVQLRHLTQLQQSPIQDETTHQQFPPQQSLQQLDATQLLESSEDEVIFVAAVAAPVRPPRERRQIGVLRPRAVSSEGDEYFVEEVVGWKIQRGREFFLIKWAGYSDDYNTWENGQEKRREIPNMVADYFDELGVTDDEDNFDNTKDITYVNSRKKRRLL
jgi:hypothetical protein